MKHMRPLCVLTIFLFPVAAVSQVSLPRCDGANSSFSACASYGANDESGRQRLATGGAGGGGFGGDSPWGPPPPQRFHFHHGCSVSRAISLGPGFAGILRTARY